ncbi:hypothetical protein FBZ85_106105 [Azospirillum brasilense]|nr:hypothetical protein [Azospirillum baldaniorum]TWA77945.1 hypothetical protein FBZ85_106105 [Azospirillum brasilense]
MGEPDDEIAYWAVAKELADHAHTLERQAMAVSERLRRKEKVKEMDVLLLRSSAKHVAALTAILFPAGAAQGEV